MPARIRPKILLLKRVCPLAQGTATRGDRSGQRKNARQWGEHRRAFVLHAATTQLERLACSEPEIRNRRRSSAGETNVCAGERSAGPASPAIASRLATRTYWMREMLQCGTKTRLKCGSASRFVSRNFLFSTDLPSGVFFDLGEFEFDRRGTAENRHRDLHPLRVFINVFNNAGE